MSYRKAGFIATIAAIFIMTTFSLGAAQMKMPLDPTTIPKYTDPLIIPPAMPRAGKIKVKGDKNIDYYEIEVVQFDQHILPAGFPLTTVWSYGALGQPLTRNYPAFTIEAKYNRPLRVKWINNLVDANGEYLPHLLPVDQTLHWANPPKDCIDGNPRTDCRGSSQDFYTGPVPIITHVHGAHVGPESDGYPEAWYLPNANNIPVDYATRGTLFDQYDRTNTEPGTAVFQYPNDQRATTLWYHDHSLGITRLNVYAGPAGFYLLRGGNADLKEGVLPGPAPALGDPPGLKYYEIPIVVQDRSFNTDGSLFYPDNRAFFEGVTPDQLLIDFIPDSDVSPIWNPEAFFNTMVVNGRTWPYLNVEPRKYRLRLLNGCNSRFLILKLNQMGLPFQVIGTEGGFLAAPVALDQLLIGPAERMDVVVDFSGFSPGQQIIMENIGPDEPFGGGIPGTDFPVADPATTGQVMAFNVVPLTAPDTSVVPATLSTIMPLVATNTRQVSLNEEESLVVCVYADANGEPTVPITQIPGVLPPDCGGQGVPFGPTAALLGTLDPSGSPVPQLWANDVTENPALNTTEVWEIYNFTEDAHPIHLHLVQFQVVDRQPMGGLSYPREVWETGFKDTVIAYPGEITRVKAHFDIAGLYVWHCHILEHEDNEMMRPYCVGGQDTCPIPIAMP